MDPWSDETVTEGWRALDLFTDRHQACRLFLGYLNNDSPRSSILYFHGDGGNGKSLLLAYLRTRLCKRVRPENWAYLKTLPDAKCVAQVEEAEDTERVPIARLDFAQDSRDGFAALLKLRRDLSGSGLRFPLFDFAVVTYLHKSHQLTTERLQRLFPAEELGLVIELAGLVTGTAGGGLVLAALNAIDKHLGSWFQRYRLRRNLDEAHVTAILRMDHETELIQQLPRLFAEDLNSGLGNPDGPTRVALFFDTHEDFWGHERELVGELYFGRDEWLRRLLYALDRAAGVVVVAGREPPKWPEAPRFPLTDLDLQLVGNLADADALTYLKRTGVSDSAIRRRLCEDARVAPNQVHPFYLGLGADLALAATQGGIALTPADLALRHAAGSQRQRLLDRLLRYVDAEVRDAVRAASACRSFDEGIYRYLGEELGFQTSRAGFGILAGFSFVQRGDEDQYRIHDLLRRLQFEQDEGLVRAAHTAMERYYRPQAEAGSEAAIAEAIYHANRLDWRRGVREWFVVFHTALHSSHHTLCRTLLDVRDELLIESNGAAGLVSTAAAEYLLRHSRYEEARAECSEAIAAFDAALDEDPNEPELLSNSGNAHILFGEVEVALDQREAAEDRFRAGVAAFDAALIGEPDNFTYLSNKGKALLKLGELEVARGQPDAAEESFLDAEAAVAAALERAPGESPLFSNLGVIQMNLADLRAASGHRAEAEKRYRLSISAFDKALRRDPNVALIHNNRGSAFHRRGKMYAKQRRRRAAERSYRAAIRAADRALQLAPDYLLALSNKGMYCEELGWLILVWALPQRLGDARYLRHVALRAFRRASELASDNRSYRQAVERISAALDSMAS